MTFLTDEQKAELGRLAKAATPKWFAKARNYVEAAKPFKTGSIAHLFEMATADYESVLATKEKAEAEREQLIKALTQIAAQKIGDEIGDEYNRDNADYELGYESIVKIAREALATPHAAAGTQEKQ